jgi:phosphate transport system permease protein
MPMTTFTRNRNGVAGLSWRRRIADGFGWAACTVAFLLLAAAVVSILAGVAERGWSAMGWSLLTHITQGTGGGLLNAIEGTLVLAGGGLLLAVPVGVACGIYLAEFGQGAWAPTVRFLADVMVGLPSIVVGYFVYILAVEDLGWSFSMAAGSIALAMISLPYICRSSELALRQVPQDLRHAARALGAGDQRVIFSIALPLALPSIFTGILLALAISVGETAPLLYTAGWSNYLWTGHLTHEPVGYLTYAIWAFITEPFAQAHALAYAAALLVTVFVLVISVASRVALAASRRRMPHA